MPLHRTLQTYSKTHPSKPTIGFHLLKTLNGKRLRLPLCGLGCWVFWISPSCTYRTALLNIRRICVVVAKRPNCAPLSLSASAGRHSLWCRVRIAPFPARNQIGCNLVFRPSTALHLPPRRHRCNRSHPSRQVRRVTARNLQIRSTLMSPPEIAHFIVILEQDSYSSRINPHTVLAEPQSASA